MTDIGTTLAQLQKRIDRLERASRLSSASLDDTALQVKDGTGSLRGILGVQGDGTTAVNIVNGGPPPAPATPTAAPALGGVSAGWDGTFADGAIIPLDWARVEVHASPTPAFTPSADTLQATIETAQGGIVYIPSTEPLYVALLARNTSGTASPATAEVGPHAPKPVAGEIGIGEITETLIGDGAVTTPKVYANAITTALLAAGSVDATALKADAITGKTITGGTINGTTVTGATVQTGNTGTRTVMSPSAGGTGKPGVALYSGAANENTPGLLWATVLNYGSFIQPTAYLEAPYVDSGNAYARLVSPAGGGGGRFQVATSSTRDYAYIKGQDGDEAGTSQVEIFTQNGASGPSSVLQVKGEEIYMRSASVTLQGNATVTGLIIKDTTWSALSYATGWTGFGSPYGTGRYRKMPDGSVILRDLIKRTASTTITNGEIVATLPVGYRPVTTVQQNTVVGGAPDNSLSVNININGTITLSNLVAGSITYLSSGSGFFSLNGFQYFLD